MYTFDILVNGIFVTSIEAGSKTEARLLFRHSEELNDDNIPITEIWAELQPQNSDFY